MSVRYGEQDSLLARSEHACSLAEDDYGQRPIDITPLVTRVARYVKVMEGAEVTFLPETEAYRYEVGLEHFVQGHMMREGPGNSIFMCYPGYDRKIELLCPRLSLLGEKSNISDGEKRTRTIECCRSTNEE